jgi:hypothetical protein
MANAVSHLDPAHCLPALKLMAIGAHLFQIDGMQHIGTLPNIASDRRFFKSTSANLLPVYAIYHLRMDSQVPQIILAPLNEDLRKMIKAIERSYARAEAIVHDLPDGECYATFSIDLNIIIRSSQAAPVAQGVQYSSLRFVSFCNVSHRSLLPLTQSNNFPFLLPGQRCPSVANHIPRCPACHFQTEYRRCPSHASLCEHLPPRLSPTHSGVFDAAQYGQCDHRLPLSDPATARARGASTSLTHLSHQTWRRRKNSPATSFP